MLRRSKSWKGLPPVIVPEDVASGARSEHSPVSSTASSPAGSRDGSPGGSRLSPDTPLPNWAKTEAPPAARPPLRKRPSQDPSPLASARGSQSTPPLGSRRMSITGSDGSLNSARSSQKNSAQATPQLPRRSMPSLSLRDVTSPVEGGDRSRGRTPREGARTPREGGPPSHPARVFSKSMCTLSAPPAARSGATATAAGSRA